LAGSEDGREDIDSLMASIYLRIAGDQNNKWVTRFKNSGFQPSGYPQGHWNINYGLLDIHRRNDWLLTIRGHNRYFTTHEAYPGANMYGRYLSYGFLEVTWPQSENNRGSSFKDEGWDWNNIPGTTSLHLPIEKLRANILNVDDFSGVEEMLISDQVFAGGTNWNHQDGVFAMKLHGHDKYDMGSFWANKSWFMFDSIIVCLGSDISNSISQYRTQTTLFQNVLDSKSEEFDIDGQVNNGWPYEQTWRDGQEVSIVDNRHIGYYIPDAENLIFIGREQQSRDQKDQRDTKGNVATLVWDHGKAPVKKGYEYAMLPGTTPVAMAELVKTMKSDHTVYQVLRKDSLVHALYYAPKKMTALALFNHNLGQSDSLILSNNRPALVMYRMQNDTLSMSVTDPDLEFYSGPDDSPVDENGRRKEVSIYSRKWYKTPSQPSVLDFSLKGKWKLISDDNRMQLTYLVDGNTQVSIPCEYGLASRVELAKKDD
jgi:chondroitin-sulfate-ABC endolyase/exolyase